jgi:hypothetical protein
MDFESIQSDLKFIREVVDNNRKVFIDNGLMFISTGVFITIGLIMNYVLAALGLQDYILYAWVGWVALIIITNMIVGGKHQTKLGKKTFASEMFGYTWLATGIPIMIFFIVFVATRTPEFHTFVAAISSMLGIAYFLTGYITDFKLLKILAVGWWAGTLLFLLWDSFGDLETLGLVFSIMVLLFEILPGIVIYRKWKRIYNG